MTITDVHKNLVLAAGLIMSPTHNPHMSTHAAHWFFKPNICVVYLWVSACMLICVCMGGCWPVTECVRGGPAMCVWWMFTCDVFKCQEVLFVMTEVDRYYADTELNQIHTEQNTHYGDFFVGKSWELLQKIWLTYHVVNFELLLTIFLHNGFNVSHVCTEYIRVNMFIYDCEKL